MFEHYIVWLRDLDSKKMLVKISGAFINMMLENGEDKMAIFSSPLPSSTIFQRSPNISSPFFIAQVSEPYNGMLQPAKFCFSVFSLPVTSDNVLLNTCLALEIFALISLVL